MLQTLQVWYLVDQFEKPVSMNQLLAKIRFKKNKVKKKKKYQKAPLSKIPLLSLVLQYCSLPMF